MGPFQIQQKRYVLIIYRGQYIGPAHGPELSIFTSLCRPTATEESLAWARPRVNLLCSNFH